MRSHLQSVSATQPTLIELPVSIISAAPRLAGLQLTVPSNSLFSNEGTRGGRVGVAPVAPDRLPSPLPPGLAVPAVITIQTDGPANFGRPVGWCFRTCPIL